METFLYIVFFLSCIVLVVTVLLQPGKTDAGALFTSGVAKAALNPRGTASVLSKLTIIAAATFMLTALLLALPALTGNVSVLQTQGENKPATNTNTNANANTANSNANANVETNVANTNSTNTETKPDAESKGEETKPEAKPEVKETDSKEKATPEEKKEEKK